MIATIRWISTDTELPDDDMEVLIVDPENDVAVGFHDGDDGWRYLDGSRVGDLVTHWAELPEGPNS